MVAFSFPVVLEAELVYELTPGWIEGWEIAELVQTTAGICILERGHNYSYDLEPTPFVLDGLERALKRITPKMLGRGEASIGPRGLRVLERLLPKGKFAALEIAVVRGAVRAMAA